jgi:hypothetical protein
VIFGNKKIFADIRFAPDQRSPNADFCSNRLRLIRGNFAQRTPRVAKHRERSVTTRDVSPHSEDDAPSTYISPVIPKRERKRASKETGHAPCRASFEAREERAPQDDACTEYGKKAYPKVFKVQMRPDPLAY